MKQTLTIEAYGKDVRIISKLVDMLEVAKEKEYSDTHRQMVFSHLNTFKTVNEIVKLIEENKLD